MRIEKSAPAAPLAYQHQAVATYSFMAVAPQLRQMLRIVNRVFQGIDIYIVVTRTMHFCKFYCCLHRCFVFESLIRVQIYNISSKYQRHYEHFSYKKALLFSFCHFIHTYPHIKVFNSLQ